MESVKIIISNKIDFSKLKGEKLKHLIIENQCGDVFKLNFKNFEHLLNLQSFAYRDMEGYSHNYFTISTIFDIDWAVNTIKKIAV